MPRPTDAEPTDEMMLELIFGWLQKISPNTATQIRYLKSTYLAEQGVTRAATSFEAIQDVADAFKLQWAEILITGDSDPGFSWKIEQEAMKKPRFKTSERIQFLLYHYLKNFSRKSEATRRTAIDMILLEVLIVLKGEGNLDTMANDMPRTPTPNSFSDVTAHGNVGFTQLLETKKTTVITGRIDYGIGRVLSDTASRKRFQSLMLVIGAKAVGRMDHALPELLVYLASIRQSREARGRSDTSVYGVASDGLNWRFVMITDSGLIKLSRQFDTAIPENTKLVLECLAFMIETAASMSPNTTPEKGESHDPGMQVDESHDEDGDDDDNDDDE